jgi:hypothetical protein
MEELLLNFSIARFITLFAPNFHVLCCKLDQLFKLHKFKRCIFSQEGVNVYKTLNKMSTKKNLSGKRAIKAR